MLWPSMARLGALAMHESLSALGGCSSPNREAAGVLGSRVCNVNESSRAATVVFTVRDTARGEGSVAPGYQACGEGTMSALKFDA
jgi:hypothetical protein